MNYHMYPDYLYHHGIKGLKWGVRRFQNKDGSLTNAGQRRRVNGEQRGSSKSGRGKKLRKALGITLGAAAGAGLAYGGRKLYKSGALDGTISRLNARSAKKIGSYGINRATNKLKSAYLGTKDRYKNSKLGRRIATEKFKYQNGLSAANRIGERAALYGRKARSGVTNAAYRAEERAALYGRKARSGVTNARLRGSIAYNTARKKAWDTAGNIIRKRKAKKIKYQGF